MALRSFSFTAVFPPLVAGALALASCAPVPPPLAANPYPPPPAAPAETIPKPPVSGEPLVWQPGHWDWTGAGYAWTAGTYVSPQGHGTAWQPGFWTKADNGGWVWVPGHWV